MGLPGSGKTTLGNALFELLMTKHFRTYRINADIVRAEYNDWDFSDVGRIRQAERITSIANKYQDGIVIVDFIAALKQQRTIFSPDFLVWMNTIQYSRFPDTNKVFEPPQDADYVIIKKNADKHALAISKLIG